MSGVERNLAYRLALETGLRANELKSLTRSSFRLTDDEPSVTIEARSSKNGESSALPLRADTAALLKEHLSSKHPGATAFGMPASDKTSRMLQADLATAREAWLKAAATPDEREERKKTSFLSYQDGQGRFADFHALRHTFLTNLVRSNVHPKVAQKLARHSTITLTMDRYSHTDQEDHRKAVEVLPRLANPAERLRATGTDGEKIASDRVALCAALYLSQNDAIQCSLLQRRSRQCPRVKM